jgi:DNA-binding response OmpR family regulator
MTGDEAEKEQRSGRLGGARADFVASLGRKVADARDVLGALEAEPASSSARDELRRKLHALGAGARLLRFDAMARSLQEAGVVLERGAQQGGVREDDLGFLAQVLDDLPALAWGESPPRDRDVTEAAPPTTAVPLAVLVVGPESIAEVLTEGDARGGRTFECERTEDAQQAIGLARAYAPDLVVVDGDVPDAVELVEALLDDPLTEPVPILVLGSFATADESARFIALGVAKALAKPIPSEVFRAACEEILDNREGRTMRMTLGEPTLEALGNRLADEVKRALVESVDRAARNMRIPLGEGTEVLGAIWGAIARVQEVISAKTDGAIRFGGDAPEGAIALAPWLHHDLPGADRMSGRGRGAAADVRLDRRRVVVADDDPGVTWFIADLLRTAGCDVYEALDGLSALDLAFKVSPELVVSDILMPGLDGFALCRALKRDVALRDTPVILLSWKEDLLQRVRELGASAAAYLKKESDSRAIVARVREVIRPRARIEARLKTEGEVRGRLDGLTVRLLLELACSLRKNASVTVRDASFLYEIELRDGAPVSATRTASDGSFQRGEKVLASMLGVGAGRFVVSPSTESVKGELRGSLADQLARPIAAARGAQWATTGERSIHVERIVLDELAVDDYLRATPDPAREIIHRITKGASPRKMLLDGDVAPSLLEDVLCDLASRGAITVVRGPNGVDLLTPAVDAALAVILGRPQERRSTRPPAARISIASRTSASPPRSERTKPAALTSDVIAQEISSTYESLTMSAPPPPPPNVPDGSGPPSSLEDAVMREISERSDRPEPNVTSDPPPIIEPSELRPRSSNPPAPVGSPPPVREHSDPFPSIPPDAIVPGVASLPPPAATVFTGDDATKPPPDTHTETEVDAVVSPFTPIAPTAPIPAAYESEPVMATPMSGGLGFRTLIMLCLVGVGAGFAWSYGRDAACAPTPVAGEPVHGPTAPSTPAPRGVASTSSAPASPYGDIPSGLTVAPGAGAIEVTTAPGDQVLVDGVPRGVGPHLAIGLGAGGHRLDVVSDGGAKERVVEVRAGRSTHVDMTTAP